MDTKKSLSLDELLDLRPKTDAVADYLHSRLAQHLATIAPLLDPSRVLGKSMGAGRIVWMDKTLQEFKALHEEHGRPFRMSANFDPESLTDVGRVELHPREYLHEVKAGGEAKVMRMTSPTEWVLVYPSDYSPERMKGAVSGREPGQPASIHQYVLHALLLDLVLKKSPQVVELLRALRFAVEVVPSGELHGLPVVTVRFELPSFRPDDGLILRASKLSGIPAFIELVDVDGVRGLVDPMKVELEKIVG